MRLFLKITAIILLSLIVLMILLLLGYLCYIAIQYHRIDDNLKINSDSNSEIIADSNATFSALSYNIGFGAYDQEYSFFLDVGKDENGKKLKGKYGKAVSYENALKNTRGSSKLIQDNLTDFVFLQEVDTDSSRSYHINQYQTIKENLPNYSANFAANFHSAYLILPLNDPHGKNNSGIATFSKYKVDENIRRSYPVDKGFSKFFDLDRCFMISRVPLNNGKELTLINNHMSAYDKGGVIRKKQLEFLNQVLKEEKDKGNYVVVGGDFNHDLNNGKVSFPTKQPYPDWVFNLEDNDFSDGYKIVAGKNCGSCRSAEIPYEKGYNFECVVDGFVVSNNIEVISIENIDNEYRFSDHNPSKIVFKLK